MNTLQIKNLTKRFGNVLAVRHLNLDLTEGEIFVLLGPNGAGKTTTLKMIAGLIHPTEGDIRIKGFDITDQPIQAKTHIGYIPDEPFIYRKLTGREFINFIAGIYHIEKPDYERRMAEYQKRLEIGTWIDEFSENYSHGMKQKVVMCQLFIHNPDLVLIDEPLVGLDPKSSKTVREIFFELKNQGKALLICTHTLSFAREIATRIGIINHGALKFTGTFTELADISGTHDIEEIYLKLSDEPVGTH